METLLIVTFLLVAMGINLRLLWYLRSPRLERIVYRKADQIRAVPDRLSRKIRSLRAWIRQTWAKGLLLVGTLLTRKGMTLLMTKDSSPVSSDEGDPFDDFVTRYLEKHG